MSDLRKQVIKLAHEVPELRVLLVPMLREAMEFDTPEALKKYLKEHPDADKSKHHVKKQEGKDDSKGSEKPLSKKQHTYHTPLGNIRVYQGTKGFQVALEDENSQSGTSIIPFREGGGRSKGTSGWSEKGESAKLGKPVRVQDLDSGTREKILQYFEDLERESFESSAFAGGRR
jgi:hypothetical protein